VPLLESDEKKMKLMWLILIGLVVGFLSSVLTKKTDLGRLGNVLCCILGALIGYFSLDTLGLLDTMGVGGTIIVSLLSALFFLSIMKKLVKAF